MKKITVLALIPAMLLMTLAGCTQAQKEAKQAKKAEQLQAFYAENWNEDGGCYEEDVLPTKEAAEAVAQQIFDNIKGTGMKKHVVIYTTYYEAQNAWMVLFGEPWIKGEMVKLGGEYTIALNKTDGRVMRIIPWE